MAAPESVLCLSHLRWGSGNGRPQQYLRRCARERVVAYVEEPVFDVSAPALELTRNDTGVLIAVPHLVADTAHARTEVVLRQMLDRVVLVLGDPRPVIWYSTPVAVEYCDHLQSTAIVYDCTGEIERLVGTSPKASAGERWLFEHADVVFTDSYSLCMHKRRATRHPNIHPLLSCVDFDHFGRAREQPIEPAEQDEIPRPRVGFHGVIDSRIDFPLLAELAAARPDLHFVMLGPIVGVDASALPQAANLHWLGARPRSRIPAYLAGWDVAMLPFVVGEATRSSSPLEPAEYLAAGKPVVSTPVADVVRPYGRCGLVWVGAGAGEFELAIDEALSSDRLARVAHADTYLLDHSWQPTWEAMWTQVQRAIASRPSSRTAAARRARRIELPSSAAVGG